MPEAMPKRLRQSLTRSTGAWAGSRHSVRALSEPYRSWARGEARHQVESQVTLLVTAVRRGFCVYTTPEGRLTEGGWVTRFRSGWDPVMRTHPDAVKVSATTYDALCAGRLRMWTVLTEPQYPDHMDVLCPWPDR